MRRAMARLVGERLLSKFIAYQAALESVRLVAQATRRWKGWSELVDQARRASASVVLNLAEGNGAPRGSAKRDYHQRIAFGSALELEGCLDVAVAAGLEDSVQARAAAGRAAALLTLLCAPK